MDGLIPAETLAAFMDGRLNPKQREEVMALLAKSEIDREALADAIAITDEEEAAAIEPAPLRESAPRRRARVWLVPALAAAAVVALLTLPDRNGSVSSALEAIRAGSLPVGWADAGWSTVRGGDPAGRTLFRVGVRMVDLQAAVHAGDEVASGLAVELSGLLRSLPAGAPLADLVGSPETHTRETVDAAALAIREALPEPELRTGTDLELARLAALAGRRDVSLERLASLRESGIRSLAGTTGVDLTDRLDALTSSDEAGLAAGLAALIRDLGS